MLGRHGFNKKYEWKKIILSFSEESRSSGVTFDVLLKCSQHFKLSRGQRASLCITLLSDKSKSSCSKEHLLGRYSTIWSDVGTKR